MPWHTFWTQYQHPILITALSSYQVKKGVFETLAGDLWVKLLKIDGFNLGCLEFDNFFSKKIGKSECWRFTVLSGYESPEIYPFIQLETLFVKTSPLDFYRGKEFWQTPCNPS